MIHGYWLDQYGLSGSYHKRDVTSADLEAFVQSIGENGLRGCNVTVPHKVAVMALVDDVTPVARAVGAANTLWSAGGQVHATNTDVSGFMDHLCATAPDWQAASGPAVVVGAGGAARAVVYGLREAGVPEIRVVNRTLSKADVLRDDFGPVAVPMDFTGLRDALEGAKLVVNSTSLGMSGQPPLDIDLSPVATNGVIMDIVYSPLETALLTSARARGLQTVDGLGMLLHQAVPGFELWFGTRPVVTDELRDLVVATLEGP